MCDLYRICMRKRNISEVCSRNYRKFQVQDWTAQGISVKSVPVYCDYE